jgi:hypothetical protein
VEQAVPEQPLELEVMEALVPRVVMETVEAVVVAVAQHLLAALVALVHRIPRLVLPLPVVLAQQVDLQLQVTAL